MGRLVSAREFAAHHGVSTMAVSKWEKKRWIVRIGKKIDFEQSNAIVGKYRDTKNPTVLNPKGGRKKKADNPEKLKQEEGESSEEAVTRFLLSSGADMLSMEEAKRLKENYLALLNQLDYDTKSQQVVPVSEVSKMVGDDYSRVRTRLLSIPSEQAPLLHRLKTVTEVQDTLQEIITEALEELTRYA